MAGRAGSANDKDSQQVTGGHVDTDEDGNGMTLLTDQHAKELQGDDYMGRDCVNDALHDVKIEKVDSTPRNVTTTREVIVGPTGKSDRPTTKYKGGDTSFLKPKGSSRSERGRL